jgi:hypothetical protein
MLDPDLVVSTIVSALQSIPALVQQMLGNPANIQPHFFFGGQEDSLAVAIEKLPEPSILVYYSALMGGQFSQSTLYKHRIEIVMRPANAAAGPFFNNVAVMSAPKLWKCALKSGINGGQIPLQNISLLNGALLPMDIPSMKMTQDEKMVDYLVGLISFPEYGDQP